MPALRDSHEISLQHVTVFSSQEPEAVTKEIVIQRSEVTIPPGQTMLLNVARVGRSIRRIDDRAELAILDLDGNVLEARGENLRGDAALSLTLKAEGAERKVVVAAKIVRQSGQDETRFFDSVTQAPRLRAWVTLGILVEESDAASQPAPAEGQTPASGDATVMLSVKQPKVDGGEELSSLFAAALER
jgi:hypothetical protein